MTPDDARCCWVVAWQKDSVLTLNWPRPAGLWSTDVLVVAVVVLAVGDCDWCCVDQRSAAAEVSQCQQVVCQCAAVQATHHLV